MRNIVLSILIIFVVDPTIAGDWPMWRYDAGRTASSPEPLPEQLDLLWSRFDKPREPVWDDPLNQDLMRFDRLFEPIVLGKRLYLGYNDCDKVTAIDTDTGKELWSFYVDGPVRLPLAAWNDYIYFTSDDGYLYCLTADKGQLVWRFRGGPSERKILGNKRLISTWPARGGVVLEEGIAYFAAGIWPFMGTFIYALNAETGEVLWRNEGTGAQYINQPHNSPAFAGIAPQGAFVLSEDRLLIPGGRSIPGCFDKHSGEMLYFHLAEYNKSTGAFTCANNDYFFNHFRDRETNVYRVSDGEIVAGVMGKYPVIADDAFYMSGDSILVRDLSNPQNILAVFDVNAGTDLIKAGPCLYAAGNDTITCIKINDVTSSSILWKKKVDAVERLIAADRKLFAVTLNGNLFAFGTSETPIKAMDKSVLKWTPPARTLAHARKILEQTGVKEGYALSYGIENTDLPATLAHLSDLQIVGVDGDEQNINAGRQRLDELGLLGDRVSLLPGIPATFPAPPYMASLLLVAFSNEFLDDSTLAATMYTSLRPYGGTLWMAGHKKYTGKLVDDFSALGATIQIEDNCLIVRRDGPLPGSSSWTHQYGNISNTVKSDDELVKLPLGILWFGGNSNMDVLPRHGHGPPEQIIGGRLIIEGLDGIQARDVYTGRVLWNAPLENPGIFGVYYNETYADTPLDPSYNQEHLPGANSRGTNFAATSDWVYVIDDNSCRVLDIKTGETVKTLDLPPDDSGEKPDWGYLGILNDLLIAGSDFVPFSQKTPLSKEEEQQIKKLEGKDWRKYRDFTNYDVTASKRLVVMDRRTGKIKWQLNSRYGFIHNAITAGENRIFCLDKYPPAVEKRLARRGISKPSDYRLLALEAENGRVLWQINRNIFGSWLSISPEHNLLLQATRPSRDMLRDENGERMIVYNAETGQLIWDQLIEYNNPPILHGAKIITDREAYDLLTGEQIFRTDPITGERIPWTYTRTYGCNYNIAGEYLLSFRSAAAGFYDLFAEGGTGNYGGFKSGCTSNLIAADGVLNAPDYTRTCQCSYQNQTSLALIHMPELEYWTTNQWEWSGKRIQRLGINLNAPGDRVAEDGTLWLDFPSVGGESPDIPIEINTPNVKMFRRHSSSLTGEMGNWIAASGFEGSFEMEILLTRDQVEQAEYTISLYFAEVFDKKPAERIFDIYIQGQKVLENFDIIKETKSTNKTLIKSISGIKAKNNIIIKCQASKNSPESHPILSGIKIKANTKGGTL